jgi:CDP-diacylglycerol--serine O-phosphatidyltransferase
MAGFSHNPTEADAATDEPAGGNESSQAPPRTRRRGPLNGPKGRKVARGTIAVLPTLFTLANVLCGFASIFVASQRWNITEGALPFGWTGFTVAAVFIFLGMLMDGLDGRVARLTRSSSELGEQLDSMADMVTFGVAPAFLAVQLAGVEAPFVADAAGEKYFNRIGMVVACIYVVCAALRLARFNIETAENAYPEHKDFRGLPSPGAAGTVASLVLLHQHFFAHYPDEHWTMDVSAIAMPAVAALAGMAMVSTFRYVHLMNRYVRGRAPFETVAKAVVLGLLMLIHLQGAIAAAFVGYALSAPTTWVYQKLTGKLTAGSDATSDEDEWDMEP